MKQAETFAALCAVEAGNDIGISPSWTSGTGNGRDSDD